MKIILWTLQVLLALHTLMGAVWKFSNSEQIVPSLKALPHGVWISLGVIELLCSLGLILPFIRPGILVPVAATIIAAEMLLYCGLSLFSGALEFGHIIYWLVVAVIAGFIAFGRTVLKPF